MKNQQFRIKKGISRPSSKLSERKPLIINNEISPLKNKLKSNHLNMVNKIRENKWDNQFYLGHIEDSYKNQLQQIPISSNKGLAQPKLKKLQQKQIRPSSNQNI